MSDELAPLKAAHAEFDAQATAEKPIEHRYGPTDDRMAPRLLIVASLNWEGLSRTPYLFSQAGWIVDVFASPAFALAQSSFIRKIHAAGEAPSVLVEQLKSFVHQHGQDYEKIILADDPLIWELAKRRSEPWARALLPCTGQDKIIDFLVFKTDFVQGCEEHGIPIPRSFVCNTAEQVSHAVGALGFPLILKRNQGHSGKDVKLIQSERELAGLDPIASVVIQEFIQGKICSAAALYKNGVLLGYYSYFRSRTWGPFGSSTAIKFHVFPELSSVLERLGKISNFDGLCGIDFMQDESSSAIYILEQNFRPTPTMLLGPKVGVDFASLLRHWDTAAGPPILQHETEQDVVPIFPSDIVRAISQHDLPVLLRWLVDPRWIREAGWHDRKLLAHNFRCILRALKSKFASAFRRVSVACLRPLSRDEREVEIADSERS